MAVRRLAAEQPDGFAFSAENLSWAKAQIGKYPEGRQASAVIPILWRAQEQEGWVSEPVIRAIADMLDMAYIRVLEVATFYTMFQLSPVGKTAHIQVCGTTPCMLRGSDDIISICKSRISETPHTLSTDGRFSWEEVECLGACVNAPMVQMVKDTYEDLDAASFEALLDTWERGATPKPGPQTDRILSAPNGGLTSLTDPGLYDGTIAKMTRVPIGADEDIEAEPEKPVEPEKAAEKPAAETGTEAPAAEAASEKADSRPEAATAVAAPSAEDFEKDEEAAIASALAALGDDASDEAKADAVGTRPTGLTAARDGGADDLKKIRGIGQVNETRLNELGIFHFDQIAGWDRPEIRWTGQYLSFAGRIDREDWVGQAKGLVGAGGAVASEAPAAPKTDTTNGAAPTASRPEAARGADDAEPALDDAARPIALAAAEGGKPDDLKRIKGIGPKIEGILHELGVFHFHQVAAWTGDNKHWVDGYLRFKGRIDREDWINQAAKLAAEADKERNG
ncbi:MAG: NADH-quinone oxidoreductase subunit NuoE [Pseudomonadota bacterium]